MIEFEFKADTKFYADDLIDAFEKLAAHFKECAGQEEEEETDSNFLDHVGTITIMPVNNCTTN